MEDWDQATLESVIAQKEKVRTATPTEIICKYFLDAVEQRKYGFRQAEIQVHRLCTC